MGLNTTLTRSSFMPPTSHSSHNTNTLTMPRFESIAIAKPDEKRSAKIKAAAKAKKDAVRIAVKKVKDAEKQKRADARAKKAAKKEEKAKKAKKAKKTTTKKKGTSTKKKAKTTKK